MIELEAVEGVILPVRAHPARATKSGASRTACSRSASPSAGEGKANKAAVALLARELALRIADSAPIGRHVRPEHFLIAGISLEELARESGRSWTRHSTGDLVIGNGTLNLAPAAKRWIAAAGFVQRRRPRMSRPGGENRGGGSRGRSVSSEAASQPPRAEDQDPPGEPVELSPSSQRISQPRATARWQS